MTGADWQRMLRIVDEVYADYLSGMAAPRKRVVDDMWRKLTDSEVLDGLHLGRHRQPESDRLRQRSVRIREAAASVEADEPIHRS